MGPQGHLKYGKVARLFRNRCMIISDIEISHSINGSSCTMFRIGLNVWWDSHIFNCYGIEGLQIMNNSKFSVFLGDAKPPQPIGRSRRFVHAAIYLCVDEFDDIVFQAWWDWNILQGPWLMLYCWNDYWLEIVEMYPALNHPT